MISPPGQAVLMSLSLLACLACVWSMISTVRTIIRIRRMGPEFHRFADPLWLFVFGCAALFVVNLAFLLVGLHIFTIWPLEAARSYAPLVGPER